MLNWDRHGQEKLDGQAQPADLPIRLLQLLRAVLEEEGDVNLPLLTDLDDVVDWRGFERPSLRLKVNEGAVLQLVEVVEADGAREVLELRPVARHELLRLLEVAPGHVLWIPAAKYGVGHLVKR